MKFSAIINIDTDAAPNSTELRQAELSTYELYNSIRAIANKGGFVAYSNAIRATGSRIRMLLAMLTIYCRFDYISSTDYAGQDMAGLPYQVQKDLIGKGLTSMRSCYICGMPRPNVTRFYTTGETDENTAAIAVFGLMPLPAISTTDEGIPLSDKIAKEIGWTAAEWFSAIKTEIDAGKDILISVSSSGSPKGSDWSVAFKDAVLYAKSKGCTFVNPSEMI